MRIIAGTARGRTLVTPKGTDTRPTLDRVRESLFGILQPLLRDADVLDLFAGSGALGLEAISRGAAGAVFVDRARSAQEAIRRNIAAVGAEDCTRLLLCDWKTALGRLQSDGARFDLIFLDPPYKMPDVDRLFAMLHESRLVNAGGLVIYEHAAADLPQPDGWTLEDQRKYGDTMLSFLMPAA